MYEYRPTMDHPFAAQSLGVLIAFSVCFRTNIAWSRFWESCQDIVLMFSKWSDAYSQLQGFISSAIRANGLMEPGKEEQLAILEHARFEVTHYFSLLSAIAVERLMRGDIRRMQLRTKNGASWSQQIVHRENLRQHDLTGARNLCHMQVLDLDALQASLAEDDIVALAEDLASDQCFGENGEILSEPGEDGENTISHAPSVESFRKPPQRRATVQMSAENARKLRDNVWEMPLPVIGHLSKLEVDKLKHSRDRMILVLSWINQLVTDLVPHLTVPTPIISRVFQEISNGALGYSQAQKLADIPFPFIFAQLLAVAILAIAIISPVAFILITGDTYLGPVLSTMTVLSFWSMNEMAKELENPFGVEANNVPIIDYHERFVHALAEVHGINLPSDRSHGARGADNLRRSCNTRRSTINSSRTSCNTTSANADPGRQKNDLGLRRDGSNITVPAWVKDENTPDDIAHGNTVDASHRSSMKSNGASVVPCDQGLLR